MPTCPVSAFPNEKAYLAGYFAGSISGCTRCNTTPCGPRNKGELSEPKGAASHLAVADFRSGDYVGYWENSEGDVICKLKRNSSARKLRRA
ncbi:hypothetical protein Trydic_g21150 [Trypoxylus dichotomus]